MYRLCKFAVFDKSGNIALWNYWRRHAGHSKWQNIRHTKGLKDAQRAALFTKLSRLIRVAVQDGKSADPDQNFLLAQAIERAKKNNMPITTIKNAITVAKGSNAASKTGHIELKGPSGSIMLVSVLTDNMAKTRTELYTIIKKTRASPSEGVARMFEYKGVIEATPPPGVNFDAAEEHAIEIGAEDVQQQEGNVLQFTCSGDHFYAVKKGLQTHNYEIVYAEQEYVPKTQVALTDSVMEELASIYEKVEQHPDVVRIYDNIV